MREGRRDFQGQAIIDEGYGVTLPATHKLAGREESAAEELALEPMIVRRHCEALSTTSRHFVERGVRPHFALRSTNEERVMQMVAAGLGVTVMPLCYRWPGVVRARSAKQAPGYWTRSLNNCALPMPKIREAEAKNRRRSRSDSR